MTVFYNLAYLIVALAYLPSFLARMKQAAAPRKMLLERLGILGSDFRISLLGRKVIWLHAVSVGEVMAVRDFISKLLDRCPEYHLVLTTVTPTGQKIAGELSSSRISVCYFPFDFSLSVRSFLAALKPDCLLLAETEIWPNLISEAARARVPVGILNARLSPRSATNYRRFGFIFRNLFESLAFVMVQTEKDKERFIAAGADPARIRVAGNMKYDGVDLEKDSAAVRERLRALWHIPRDCLVGVAGSTHPGEEELLGRIYNELKRKFSPMKWIIAPRHIERAPALVKTLNRLGLRCARLSSFDEQNGYDVLILDQLGILRDAYAVADIVFMGGSMVRHGGQNPIEAAAFRRAILHGPYVFNFEKVYSSLNEEGGSILAKDAEELVFALGRLLGNASERERIGENAYKTILRFRGSTERHVLWVAGFLRPGHETEPGPVGRQGLVKG